MVTLALQSRIYYFKDVLTPAEKKRIYYFKDVLQHGIMCI